MCLVKAFAEHQIFFWTPSCESIVKVFFKESFLVTDILFPLLCPEVGIGI